MNIDYDDIKDKLKRLPGVSINSAYDQKAESYKQSFQAVQNNLSFLKACMSKVIAALREVQQLVLKLEEFYRTKMDGTYSESELEVFEKTIKSELLKVSYIQKSTKYKGIPLLDKDSEKFIEKINLLIDIHSDEKFEIDFLSFDIDPYLELNQEAGINLGAKNKFADLTLLFDQESLRLNKGGFKKSFFSDFDCYRFNLERMLDRALSINATIESKSFILKIIQDAITASKDISSEIKKIDFASLKNHIDEDAKKMARFL